VRPGAHSNAEPAGRGILYLVGVPIGHPDDITLRALRVLREADLIASEDPAATQTLLDHHRIHATVTSYGPANLREKVRVLVHRLEQGARIALVSDSGSPVIADPGCLLVATARQRDVRVLTVPGPSALTAAVAAAGLPEDSFCFHGQLPETEAANRRRLIPILKDRAPAVLFCTPRSLSLAVQTIARLAPRRLIALACDLTCPEEKVIQGTARRVQELLRGTNAPQNVTLLIRRTARVKQVASAKKS
jgi:16S rRNA (cytidine1402-2'-O)-methyltransferase